MPSTACWSRKLGQISVIFPFTKCDTTTLLSVETPTVPLDVHQLKHRRSDDDICRGDLGQTGRAPSLDSQGRLHPLGPVELTEQGVGTRLEVNRRGGSLSWSDLHVDVFAVDRERVWARALVH